MCRVSGGIASCIRNFRTDFLEEWPTPGTGPHFDTSMQSNFTGLVGKTVHLVCKVKNLGNRTVSLFSLFFLFSFLFFSYSSNETESILRHKYFPSYLYKLNNWKLLTESVELLFPRHSFRFIISIKKKNLFTKQEIIN